MNKIYLDNAATTAVAPEVIDVMAQVQREFVGNPSSLHSFGAEAKKAVNDAREFISFFVGASKPEEIIFTSGGSESDNLAIRGLVTEIKNRESKIEDSYKPHVVTSAIEHHAVLHTVQDLEKQGIIEATYIKPDAAGIINPKTVEEAIKDNTVLVSIMYVNNETGVINPIREIGKMLVERNKESATRNKRIYFHTDAVQAAEFFQMAPEYLHVDMITMTGHKFHGPKGVGVLCVRQGTPIKSQITGGTHEFGKRAGTENVAGVIGLSRALGLLLKDRADSNNMVGDKAVPELMTSNYALKIRSLRDKLEGELVAKIPDARINGDKVRRAPHISNISFLNAEGESILLNLDFEDIAVSTGSACTSTSLEPSHVLTAMGIEPKWAHGSVRFSLSRYTTEEEIDRVIEVLPPIIEKLRQMSPFK